MRQTHLPSQMQRVSEDSMDGIAVPAQTLLQVMDRVGGTVDLVKMDIEGSEYEVLLNTAPKQLKRIRRMVLEYHGTVGEHNSPATLSLFLRSRLSSSVRSPQQTELWSC